MNKKFYVKIGVIILLLTVFNILFVVKLYDQNQKLKDEIKTLQNSNVKKQESITILNNKLADLEEKIEENENNESTEKGKEEEQKTQNDEDNLKLNLDLKYDAAVKKLDKKVFLTDFENYKPKSNKVEITEKEAKKIADKGFEESRRIAVEGVDNKESEWVRIEEVYANNYFTRLISEGDEVYQNIKRKCYSFSRENEMGCGVSIYVDVTTGLIIGGDAFGD